MDCLKCNSAKHIKDGKINSRQRYLYKNCGRRYTIRKRSTEKSDKLHTYVENKKTTVGYGLLLTDLENAFSTCLWETQYQDL